MRTAGVVKYGGVTLDDEEEEALLLHPKYAVFDKVDAVDCEAEIEKCLAKVRWSRSKEKKTMNTNMSIQTPETVQTPVVKPTPTFNIDTQTFDFRESRATELPFQRKVKPTRPSRE